MSENLKVSVIVPVYNAEKFLSKCLEHLIYQTYKNLEIIIVDDGSTDNVASVYNKYEKMDSRIIIHKQKNSGPSVAQNKGLDLATGDYIHFHDHDDFVNLDYYEIMMDAALKTNPDILCGEVNQPEYNFPEFKSIEICVSMQDKILKTRANLFTPAWRYLYKKSFLTKTKLRFEAVFIGDQDVIFTKTAVILASNIALIPNALYNVISNETALGKRNPRVFSIQEKIEREKVSKKYFKCVKDNLASEFMGMSEIPFKTEIFKIFNRAIFRKNIFGNKTRYYLFGINIGTKQYR